jgi:hypothetical protein
VARSDVIVTTGSGNGGADVIRYPTLEPLLFQYNTANGVRIELGSDITVQGREIRIYDKRNNLVFHEITDLAQKITDLITEQVEEAFKAGELA